MMVQILAKMSVSGTLCLIAVILLRQFMRKTRHRDFMVLWTAVMMAYCIPFSVSVKSDHPVTQAVQRAEQEIGSTVYAAVTESSVMSANDLLLILKYIYHFGKSTTPDRPDQTWVNCLNLFVAGYTV